MADEITLNEKIRELIQTNGLPSQDDLKQIIKDLLMYMKHEEMSVSDKGLGHEPIFNSDFPGNDDPSSLFKRINWRADLDEGEGALDFDNLLKNNKGELNDAGIWNESVKELIKDFKNYFVNLDEDKTITVSGKEANGSSVSNNFYIIRDILKANAGNHFKMVEGKDASSNKWTLPHLNIDNESYGAVRGNDKILEVLESAKNLDFTHTQDQVESTTQDDSAITKYIRLLMPKYIRRVEVEDLNRNFWVIGQVLSIVCAALFDDDSPIPQMLKKLSSETLQLWENVMYLWAAVNLLNEKKGEEPEPEEITAVHSEIIDYPRSADAPYRDINYFVNVPTLDLNSSNTPNRLEAYLHKYPNMHLCLLLRCRTGNYEKDYYHSEVYPYIVFYNANLKAWRVIKLQDKKGNTLGFTLRADSSKVGYNFIELRDRVYGIYDKGRNNYRYYYPFKDMPPTLNYKYKNNNDEYVDWGNRWGGADSDVESADYYSMVQIKTDLINPKYDTTNGISVGIEFTIIDIARRLHWYSAAYDADDMELNDALDKYQEGTSGAGGDDPYYQFKFNFKYGANDQTRITSQQSSQIVSLSFDPLQTDYGYNWGKPYPPSGSSSAGTYEHGTKVGFTDFSSRHSGYFVGKGDMITYRGVSKTLGT